MSMPSSMQRCQVFGKCAADEFGPDVADVEPDELELACAHFGMDRARHDVAGREFAARVIPEHEALAVRQQQSAAFAAHRLGDQPAVSLRVAQRGRMELDHLQVGDAAAGSPGEGDAVADRASDIGRDLVHARGAAGREHDVIGVHRAQQPGVSSSTRAPPQAGPPGAGASLVVIRTPPRRAVAAA
jgi:hypothetical protein